MSKTGLYNPIAPALADAEEHRVVDTPNGKVIITDGGRSKYFRAVHVGDCVTRAVVVATGLDYKVVYDRLAHGSGYGEATARDGIHTNTEWFIEMMKLAGFVWHDADVLLSLAGFPPEGTFVVSIHRHYMTFKDGAWYDSGSGSVRDPKTRVKGYWALVDKVNPKAFEFTKPKRRAARKWVYEYGYCDRSIEALNKRWTWSTDAGELITHAYKNFKATAEQPVPFFKCKRTRATLGGYNDEETFETEHNANTNEWASQWDWETKWTPPKPFAEKVHVCCTRFKLFGIKKV